jgi:hypothetical protein
MPDVIDTRITRRTLFGKLGAIAAGLAVSASLPAPAEAAPEMLKIIGGEATAERTLQSMLGSLENMGLIEPTITFREFRELAGIPRVSERIDALLDAATAGAFDVLAVNLGRQIHRDLRVELGRDPEFGAQVMEYGRFPINANFSADPHHLSVELDPEPLLDPGRLWAELDADGRLNYYLIPTIATYSTFDETHRMYGDVAVDERWTTGEVRWMIGQRELKPGEPGYTWGVYSSGPGEVARLNRHYSDLVIDDEMEASEGGYRYARAIGWTHDEAADLACWWADEYPASSAGGHSGFDQYLPAWRRAWRAEDAPS